MTEVQNLIREAFIDPIRSVLIVDDQYPTWEEVLNDRLPAESRDSELNERSERKSWRDDPNGTLSVVSQFRKKKPALVIDIHDAFDAFASDQEKQEGEASSETTGLQETASHLHQSDLLILDYNLEGETSGLEGRLARDILKSVLRNKHFNLVIIHTQEKQLREVFYNCLISLSTPLHPSFSDKRGIIDSARERLAELSDEEAFSDSELPNYFDLGAYMNLRHPSVDCASAFREYMRGNGPLSRLHEWARKLELKGAQLMGFAYWAIERFEKQYAGIFLDEPFDGLDWSLQGERLWLRTGRGFVTFVEKDHQDLLKELQLALEAWEPSPSRLLSAKVRHEISCNGVEAEDRTLSKSHVFAYFYDLIRNGGSEEKRATLVREHLNRQTETLTHQIAPAVVVFGESIFRTDADTGGRFASHYGVDLTDSMAEREAAKHFNSYVSTLPLVPGDDHLDCGHIFQINSEWWVCATPACDMEPGQNTIAFVGSSNELRPFTALRLNEVEEKTLTERHINSGLYCFAEIDRGSITCLGLPLQDADIGSEKVTWRTFIAKNDGRLTDNTFDVLRPRLNAGEVEVHSGTAQVKAKLRYEYALNYIQKVGVSVTRIGLGYRAASFGK